MITIKFHKNIGCLFFMTFCNKKCCTQMSDISRLILFSPPFSHCFVRAQFGTAIARRFLAAMLLMPALVTEIWDFYPC